MRREKEQREGERKERGVIVSEMGVWVIEAHRRCLSPAFPHLQYQNISLSAVIHYCQSQNYTAAVSFLQHFIIANAARSDTQ